MSDRGQLKILLIGPCRSGKTTIGNFLAGNQFSLDADDYHPTVGVRVLEFEKDLLVSGKKTQKVKVALWDCSGDRKYEPGWPAMLQDAVGVVFVFNPETRNYDKELENWYTRFVVAAGGALRDSNCIILAHNSSGDVSSSAKYSKLKLPKALARIPMVSTSLDNSADSIKYEFDSLLTTIAKGLLERREREEENIVNG